YENLAEGAHLFSVRVKDEHDHIAEIERNFTVDLTPPATAITGGPSDGGCWPNSSATFAWTATDNLTGPQQLQYSYRMDADTFSAFSGAVNHAYSGLAQGEHTFTVRARDLAGNIDPAAPSVTFTVGYNDLVPLAVAVPDSAHCARPVSVGWTVANNGTCPLSGTWNDCVYLSTDSLAGSDQLLGTFEWSGTVPESGGSYSTEHQVLIPDNITGTRWLIIVTDAQNAIIEDGAEGNNTIISTAVTVTLPPHPDLRVTAVEAPAGVLSGQGSYIEWTVANLGDGAAAGGWKEYVYLSGDSLVGGDVKLSEFTYSYALDPGAAYTHVHPVVFPQDIEGDYWIIVLTDAQNVRNEYESESNNYGFSGRIAVSLAPNPNLIVAGVDAPTSANSNDDIVLSWIVQNAGGAPTSTPVWYDRVYLSTDLQPGNTGDYYLGEFQNPSYLPAGGQYAQQNRTVHIPKQVPDGAYYLVVATDARNNVDEHLDEGDNSGASDPIAVSYVPYPRPDLAVTNIVCPSMGWAGNSISLSWTVENLGDAAAQATGQPVDWVIISTDSIADPHNRLNLGGDIVGYPLEPQASYTRNASVPLPVGYSGQYYIFVWTDVDIYFDDPELGNNFSAIRPIYINTPPPADLAVEIVTAGADSVISGTSLQIQWTVRNEGAGPGYVSSWTDGIYLSSDDILDTASDMRLKVDYHSGMLEPDAAYSRDIGATIPAGLLGEYYLFVYTDIYNQVGEGGFESNNWTMRANPVRVVNPPSADLRVETAHIAGEAWSGKTVQASWVVQNHGPSATTVSAWNDNLYLSADSVYSAGTATLLVTASHSGILHLGESYENSRTIALPNGISGTYYLHAIADAGNAVYEASNESNNIGSAAFPVTLTPPPDLQVAELQSGGEVTAGGAVSMQWRVRNAGTGGTIQTLWTDRFYLSPDTVYSTSDIYITGISRNGALAPDEFYQQSRDVTIPSGYEGQYYLIARTDALNQVYEYLYEGNNAAWTPLTVLAPPPDTIPVVPPPDLAMTQVEFIDGFSDTIRWTVLNNSPNHPPTAQNYWTDRFYLSTDADLNMAGDILVGSFTHVNGLAPGASYSLEKQVALPNGAEGDYYLFGITDATGRVVELDESNNQLS
ncbi:MAG: CARDB domain-containing protein, partial [Candidatus Krumholzibacteria bacterium]|nr:CARDB domain-containing protein [Candidatus Krumholzibacteria bacterium]